MANSVMKTRRNSCQHHPGYTLPETNIASENRCLEHAFPFGAFRPIFRGKWSEPFVSGRGIYLHPYFFQAPRHGSGECSSTISTSSRCRLIPLPWFVGGLGYWPGWSYHSQLLTAPFCSRGFGVGRLGADQQLFYRVFGALGIYIQLSNGDILP